MNKTVIELFAGVGGFRCGLNEVSLDDNKVVEKKNWDFLWANQWEPSTKTQDAYNCYAKRFGDKEIVNKDIFSIDKKELPEHTLLVGGFPCQDYSVARTLSGSKGIEGKKGVLWWAIADILKEKRPPFVFLENVDRLLLSPSSQRGRDFAIMLRTFHDNGYAVEWRVINAGDYSFPQKRRRVFIIAFHNTTSYYKKIKEISPNDVIFKEGVFADIFPIISEANDLNSGSITNDFKDVKEVSDKFKTQFYNSGLMIDGSFYTYKTESIKTKTKNLSEIIEKSDVDEKYFLNEEKIEKFRYLKGTKRIPRTKPNGEPYIYSEGAMPFPENLDAPARTILTSESSVSRTSHAVEDFKTKKIRILTPIECERINEFPDNWTNTGMSEKRRYFMMGNALVVGVVKRVGKKLEKIIEAEK